MCRLETVDSPTPAKISPNQNLSLPFLSLILIAILS